MNDYENASVDFRAKIQEFEWSMEKMKDFLSKLDLTGFARMSETPRPVDDPETYGPDPFA